MTNYYETSPKYNDFYNIDARPTAVSLAKKVDSLVPKRKVKKHKIGGYITEELYEKVHVVCAAKDISLSDLFQAVLSEYVESVEDDFEQEEQIAHL